jgi:hypothetical protein
MDTIPPAETVTAETPEQPVKPAPAPKLPKEIGGVDGPEPTRYGDWQHKGRVSDF